VSAGWWQYAGPGGQFIALAVRPGIKGHLPVNSHSRDRPAGVGVPGQDLGGRPVRHHCRRTEMAVAADVVVVRVGLYPFVN
jgi:hypothetical protein